ncbi:MAG: protein tyrosine phosphatase family protein [Anaerolineae bacterium]|nr:protein tyrosine phosphatase family protein [Anaerolineae bacterium]
METIVSFLEITDQLGTGGQPTLSQFADLRSAGYEIVINLAMPDAHEALVNEGALVAQAGMIYVHLAIPWEAPTRVHVARFFDLMDLYQQDKVFVHCIKNMRVAVLVFAYRVCRLGTPISVAKQALLRIWHPHGAWLNLLANTLADFDLSYV